MATLRNKRKLTTLNKQNCEKHTGTHLAQTRERMRTTPRVILILKRGSLRARLCKILAQMTARTVSAVIRYTQSINRVTVDVAWRRVIIVALLINKVINYIRFSQLLSQHIRVFNCPFDTAAVSHLISIRSRSRIISWGQEAVRSQLRLTCAP